MPKKELTGIERQLVLSYLIEGNAPVTVSLLRDTQNPDFDDNADEPPFPIVLHGNQMRLLEEGIILIKNPPLLVSTFAGRSVRVQFYFNKLALFFVTKVQWASNGLALVIPLVINRVEDSAEAKKSGFSVTLFYENGMRNSQKINVECDFDDSYPLFVVSDFNERIDRFLSEERVSKNEAISCRAHSPKVIYLDSKVIVFAARKNDMSLTPGSEYAVLLRFPIPGPVKERKVYLSCVADDMFEDFERKRLCAIARISLIREEDERFLADKIGPLLNS